MHVYKQGTLLIVAITLTLSLIVRFFVNLCHGRIILNQTRGSDVRAILNTPFYARSFINVNMMFGALIHREIGALHVLVGDAVVKENWLENVNTRDYAYGTYW